MPGELAAGFDCKCGKFHKYPLWVYAHWTTRLVFTCPDCKREYEIFAGNARENIRRKKKCTKG